MKRKMKQELEDKLLEKFPWMESKDETGKGLGYCTPCWIGDGWYDLIINLCNEIQEHYNKNNSDINTIRIYEVKEKYGYLRVDVENNIEGIYDIINKYEDESGKICDTCGEQGSPHVRNNWIQVLCKSCAEKKGYKPIEE